MAAAARGLGVAWAILLAAASGAAACGPDSDCMVGARSYRIFLPDRPADAGPPGVVVFVHGYRGRAANEMKNMATRRVAGELGVALIAAQSAGEDWNLPGAPHGEVEAASDEIGYFDAVIADATERFGLDRDRVMLAGFSAGGMMVWTLACHRGDAYAGYAPMSGTFWAPVPESCPGGPVDLVHYHGTRDEVVPTEGRAIQDAMQGRVADAFGVIARTGDYGPAPPRRAAGLDCEGKVEPGGRRLELCLFDGGHEFRPERIADAWTRLGIDAAR